MNTNKYSVVKLIFITMVTGLVVSCASSKRGCPSNSANMGAERVLSGEKPEKKTKFKVKGMN